MKFFYGDVVKPKDGFFKNAKFYVAERLERADKPLAYVCHVIIAYGNQRGFIFSEDELELASRPCLVPQFAGESVAGHGALSPLPSTGA